MRSALLASLLVACAEPSAQLHVSARTDVAVTVHVVARTLEEWDLSVGERRSFSLSVSTCGHSESYAGRCIVTGEQRTIEICEDRLPALEYEAALRHVLLHELTHVHLTCSDRDHHPEPSHLMHEKMTRENLYAEIPTGILR